MLGALRANLEAVLCGPYAEGTSIKIPLLRSLPPMLGTPAVWAEVSSVGPLGFGM